VAEPLVEIEGRSIVIAGGFAPEHFHPSWFSEHELLRDAEIEHADVHIVHPEAASFTAGWLNIRASRDSLEASTTDAGSYDALRDLVVAAFRLMDAVRPVALGLNYNLHYKMPSADYSLAIGERLVPTPPWKLVTRPHFRTLIVRGSRDEQSEDGTISVRVEGSVLIDQGLYIGVNDHYDLEKVPDKEARSRLLEILDAEWRPSRDRARALADSLVTIEDGKD
jgi:hypothetical protein